MNSCSPYFCHSASSLSPSLSPTIALVMEALVPQSYGGPSPSSSISDAAMKVHRCFPHNNWCSLNRTHLFERNKSWSKYDRFINRKDLRRSIAVVSSSSSSSLVDLSSNSLLASQDGSVSFHPCTPLIFFSQKNIA